MDLMFLTDDTDTILAYEQRGRENKPTVSSYESGIQALQNMGRIPQVEVIQGRSEECNSRELKHASFLRHGRQPEVNISHARTVVFSRFSN